MPIRQRGETWQADIQHAGRRYRGTFKDQASALRWEAEAKIALAEGRAVPETRNSAGASSPTEGTLGTVLDLMLTTRPPQGWLGSRAETHAARAAGAAVAFFGKLTRPSTITTERVGEYVKALEGYGNSNATINRKLAALSKMLRFAKRRGWIVAMPEIDRMKESEGRLRWLTWEEQDRLVGAMRVEGQHLMADLTEFLADTGFRIGEALSLQRFEVDPRMIHLDPRKVKNGHARSVPQTERVRALLAKRATELGEAPTDALIWPVSYNTYRGVFDRAKQRARLGDDVTPHTLRHTCASRLVQQGIDIMRVKNWMGHRSLVVTMRYAHLAPEHLYEAAAALARTPQSPRLTALDGGKSVA